MNYNLLILLFICHYFADYSHLSTAWMLNAKRFGKPLLPIVCHAAIHAVLMFSVMLFFNVGLKIAIYLALYQLTTHFLIDVTKGTLNVIFPSLSNPTNKKHWYIFGLDQLCHQIVIIQMIYYISIC